MGNACFFAVFLKKSITRCIGPVLSDKLILWDPPIHPSIHSPILLWTGLGASVFSCTWIDSGTSFGTINKLTQRGGSWLWTQGLDFLSPLHSTLFFDAIEMQDIVVVTGTSLSPPDDGHCEVSESSVKAQNAGTSCAFMTSLSNFQCHEKWSRQWGR